MPPGEEGSQRGEAMDGSGDSGSKVERWAAGEAPGTLLRPTMMNYFDGNNQDEMLMQMCQQMDTQPDDVLLLGHKWNCSLSLSLSLGNEILFAHMRSHVYSMRS